MKSRPLTAARFAKAELISSSRALLCMEFGLKLMSFLQQAKCICP